MILLEQDGKNKEVETKVLNFFILCSDHLQDKFFDFSIDISRKIDIIESWKM